MTPPAHFLAVLGVVLFFGLLLPQLLRPLHLPFATSLIVAGALLGPHGLGTIAPDDNLVLFAFLGATFQMLLAGSEARTLDVRLRDPDTARMALLNGVLPAIAGVALARAFDYAWTPSLFLGIVFLSSSIMLVFGMVGSLGIEQTRAGRLLKSVAVVEDLGASLLAFVLFQTLEPHQRFPLPILAGLLLSSVVVLRMFLPEVVAFLFRRLDASGEEGHEVQLRVVVALLLVVVFGYSALDVHPVIAAFLVGFTLAGMPETPRLRGRLESLGYGLFIPVFLFVVGLDTDLGVLWRFEASDPLALAILLGAIGTKLVGGFAGARWSGLGPREAAVVGTASTAKLAVPLSATYAARDLGILDPELFSAVVIVSVTTSIFVPGVLALAGRRRAAREA
jgi:Kef-type K+ transport system membrane component KefB